MAFFNLKEVVTCPPILDFAAPFTSECDASTTTIEVVLMLQGRLIAYFSRALKGRTLLLSTYENELFALMSTVVKWRPYLLGGTFKVKTDQQIFKHLLDQRVGISMQQKWVFKLLGYNFVVE